MKQGGLFKLSGYLLSAICLLSGCSIIDEDKCVLNYIEYRYLNNVSEDANSLYLNEVTDFIFTKDSVLYRVDEQITGGRITKRPINLPDGDWIVYSYANLNGGSKVSDYVVGKTSLRELSVRVVNPPTYTGTYASSSDDSRRVGNSDRLYFGKVSLTVKGGYTEHAQAVDMSNVHIWLSATVRWKKTMDFFAKSGENLHVRLEYVPVEFGFLNDEKVDNLYGIPYNTPRITEELATYSTRLQPTAVSNEYSFEMYGLRWESGRAPVLRLYDGETLLVGKDLPLNKYFEEQHIDLTHTRVQFYQLLIEVDDNTVVISNISISDWEDGGSIW